MTLATYLVFTTSLLFKYYLMEITGTHTQKSVCLKTLKEQTIN